jgi:hypothetical protein
VSIKRFNGAGIYGTKSIKVWDQTTVQNDFQSIATVVVPSGGQSTVTFSNIPSTYAHLQVRGVLKLAESGTSDNWATFTMNGASTNSHQLQGSGSAASGQNLNSWFADAPQSGVTPFGAFIVDILDYGNNSKNKTWRSINGFDNNGSGYIQLTSGFVIDTNPISSIAFGSRTGSGIAAGSTFALYGIKVAS